ncbi:gliding motility-associated C-terminal domain-containing protein [Marinoscillum sp.]|uniref:T9SS type B sorting domain-containing protein n=1 Tax=Marinoscillum sp. TaxID=2024838 RepID=UPI003BAB31B3
MIRIDKTLLFKTLATAVLSFGMILKTSATHIRAGEITARRVDNLTLTYEFTFTGFRDSGSVIEFGAGTFDFGDGNSVDADFQIVKTAVGNETEMVQFKLRHTYQAANSYIVSYKEEYRNAEIINMDNSVNTTFYVESLVVIDPFYGTNNTPVLTVPPIDYAAVGSLFIHNAGAFDPDGDSLSYKFTTPKQARNAVVNGYRALNNPDFYTNFSQGNQAQNNSPELSIDPITGDLVWDAPGDVLNQGDKAEYNVAFVVEEWRYIEAIDQWVRLGFVTRDMQIIVEDTDNDRPTIKVPENICVEAGTSLELIIEGNDPDGDPVKLEAFGGPFEVFSPATYSPRPAQFEGPPGYLTFNWDTQCGHVRARPYQVQFKVTDNPDEGPSLVDFATVEITVVAPAPTGLEVEVQPNRAMKLNWDPYTCLNASDSIAMQVWRRVGEYDIEVDDCEVGMPGNTGYQLIDRVPINQTFYLDDNNGQGLAPGAKYCYRLVTEFGQPEGGLSYVSAEACDSLNVTAPVITNVDVQSTDTDDGSVLVRWTPPYQIDQVLYPPAYTYSLHRSTEGGSFETVTTDLTDTVFVENGLNTFNEENSYYVKAYDANGNYVDSSATASTVRLELKPLLESIELNWSANVPWSNQIQEYPYHYIWRDQVGSDLSEIVLIDSVDVTTEGFTYWDNGRFNDTKLDDEIEYCYYVTTQGSYDNELLPEPLLNTSQIACGQPNDTIPPCTPPNLTLVDAEDCESILSNLPCGTNLFSQEINWGVDRSAQCDDDVVEYNVYLSETGREEDYQLIATTPVTRLVRSDLTSIKGCYRITAVDRSGNESAPTEEICRDNCPVYKLPNVFTPNNDGTNDVFAPLNNIGLGITGFNNADCPRFVRSVDFKVFDRSGAEVFVYDSFENSNGIFINWDGTNKIGEDLPAGVYYYSAEVVFDVLDPDDANQVIKGWVQLLR